MKYQIYIKKEIKSDADFPTKEGEYIVSSGNEKAAEWFFPDNPYDESDWREDVDWYLQPIELDLPDDEEIEKQARITHNDNTYRWIYTLAIHWLKNKIENQLK
jgi:hypothetical protein